MKLFYLLLFFIPFTSISQTNKKTEFNIDLEKNILKKINLDSVIKNYNKLQSFDDEVSKTLDEIKNVKYIIDNKLELSSVDNMPIKKLSQKSNMPVSQLNKNDKTEYTILQKRLVDTNKSSKK